MRRLTVRCATVLAVLALASAACSPSDGESFDLASEANPGVFTQREAPDWEWYSYVVPDEVDDIPAPPVAKCRERRAWAYDLGGVDANLTRIDVTLTGNADSQVVINEIRAIVLTRGAPMAGSWLHQAYSFPAGCNQRIP